MKAENRIILNEFPEDWQHYTLVFPVARYKYLSTEQVIEEMDACTRAFYSTPRIVRRVAGDLWGRRQPLRSLVSNLSCRNNARLNCEAHADFKRERGNRGDRGTSQT